MCHVHYRTRLIKSSNGAIIAIIIGIIISFLAMPTIFARTEITNIAVLYFDNESVTDRELLQPLEKGITDSLITALRYSHRFQVVERERIEALLSELQLGQSGLIDPKTSQKLGKILGVQALLLGSFATVGNYLRIDARIVEVESGLVVKAEEVTGKTIDIFQLEKSLIRKITSGLKPSYSQKERDNMEKRLPRSFLAFTAYSKGLEYCDRGQYDEAKIRFEEALKIDPNYSEAAERIDGIMKRAKQKYIVAVLPFDYSKTSSGIKNACESVAIQVSDGLEGIRGVAVTNRINIKSLIDTMQVTTKESLSEGSALTAGRLLGANVLIFGSCHPIKDQLRITIKIVKTETGSVISSEMFAGDIENISKVDKEIVHYIRKSLSIGNGYQ